MKPPLISLLLCLMLVLTEVALATPPKETLDLKNAVKSLEVIEDEHRSLIKGHLKMSRDESSKFWPIYDRYAKERQHLIQSKIDYAKILSEELENINDEIAMDIIKSFIATDRYRIAMWEKYLPEFVAAMGAKKTARFYQMERRIRIFVDAELSKTFPLIPE